MLYHITALAKICFRKPCVAPDEVVSYRDYMGKWMSFREKCRSHLEDHYAGMPDIHCETPNQLADVERLVAERQPNPAEC